MKKFLLFLITVIIAGCTNLTESLTPVSVSIASQEKIAASVSNSDLYAVGSAKIDASGSFIAEGKARNNARENLKNKISDEVSKIFNTYMTNVDSNSRRVYTTALPDLKNYTTETLLLKASEKIALVDGDKSYVAVAVKKDDIIKESKFVFTEYTSSVIKKLESIKTAVANNNFGVLIEENTNPFPVAPKKKEIPVSSEKNTSSNIIKDTNVKNNDFPSIDEDPLFQ